VPRGERVRFTPEGAPHSFLAASARGGHDVESRGGIGGTVSAHGAATVIRGCPQAAGRKSWSVRRGGVRALRLTGEEELV